MPTEHPTLRRRGTRRLIVASVAIGTVGALGLAVAGPSATPSRSPALRLADTSSTAGTTPTGDGSSSATGAPAPPGFAAQLIQAYDEATAANPAANASSSGAQTSPQQFASSVDQLTPDELNDVYDAATDDWTQVFAAVSQYAASPAAAAAGADAGAVPPTTPVTVPSTTTTTAPASSPTTVPSSTTGPSTTTPTSTTTPSSPTTSTSTTTVPSTTTSTTTSPSTTVPPTSSTTTGHRGHFAAAAATPAVTPSPVSIPTPNPVTPQPAPSTASVTGCSPSADYPTSGGYQTLYALTIAQQSATAAANGLSALFTLEDDYGTFTSLAAAPFIDPASVADLYLALAEQAASAVVGALAAGLQIPVDAVNYTINLANDCAGNNESSVVSNIDGNIVGTETNANAIYGLDQSNLLEDQAIYSELDSRTTGIIAQLNTAQASLDADLRHSIEEALVGGTQTAIVSYELPASLGGYLDATPIGVQAIVTSTLASMQTAGQSVSPAATSDLNTANAALQAHQYKAAFAAYQAAYQLIVH